MKFIDNYLEKIDEKNLYPERYTILKKNGIQETIKLKSTSETFNVWNYCSNDILGHSQDARIKQLACDAIHNYGVSTSSCNLFCGRLAIHEELEQAISEFKGFQYTNLFLNAWMAAQAFTDTLCHLSMSAPGYKQPLKTLILVDQLNHSCLHAAATNSKQGLAGQLIKRAHFDVTVKAYSHNDPRSLKKRLERHADKDTQIIVMTDSVFSMDGDVAPLPDLVEVLKPYPGSAILFDEAHSTGAIGRKGAGIFDHFGVNPQDVLNLGIYPFVMTTFSKFGGSVGAAISGFHQGMSRMLEVARTSSGTASLAPPLAAAALASINNLKDASPKLVKLHENTSKMRSELAQTGLDIRGNTQIFAIDTPNHHPRDISDYLIRHHQVWVTGVWYVAKPSLRIMANAEYSDEDIYRLVHALKAASEHFDIAKNDVKH